MSQLCHTILVTGANGQLGREMQEQALQYPRHIWFFTDIVGTDDGIVTPLDITRQEDVEAFVANNNVSIIVNCAAYTAVDKAEANEQQSLLLNAIAPGFLALAIERRRGQMIHISTDYVFDGTAHTPYTEEQTPAPTSAYGRTKLQGEQAVTINNPSGMIIRTAWLYSPYGNNFVKTMLRLGRERDSIGVVSDQIGTPTNAHDLAEAIMTAITQGIIPGIYHFTDEGVTSWYDFARTIHRLGGIHTCNVQPVHTAEYPTAASRPAYSVLDKSKIKATYGITIPWWEDALAACIDRIGNHAINH